MYVNKNKLPKVEPVKLKPMFGMKPGKWLTILYALILLLILFLVGVLPDLVHPGKRVTFTSNLTGAVYLDGSYAGGTPFTTKVHSGTHNVRFTVGDCDIQSFDIKVGRPVFFAWLFPRKQTVNIQAELTKEACASITKAFLTDAAAYSAIHSYDSVNHYPPIYTTWVNNVKDCSYKDLKAFETALDFVTTPEMQLDAQNACDIIGINLAVQIAKPQDVVTTEPTCTFNKADGSYLVDGSFYTSRLPVSEAQFAQFIAENPQWAASNKTNLVEQGFADTYYLSDFIGSEMRPVHNISRYAAEAYCQWMSKKTGKTVKLPTETQWMQICLAGDQDYQKTLLNASKSLLPSGLFGGLWEMTDTFYIPGNRSTEEAQEILASYSVDAEFVVKGGSYINSASEITAQTAGTAPWSLCSDYMGFRTIWY